MWEFFGPSVFPLAQLPTLPSRGACGNVRLEKYMRRRWRLACHVPRATTATTATCLSQPRWRDGVTRHSQRPRPTSAERMPMESTVQDRHWCLLLRNPPHRGYTTGASRCVSLPVWPLGLRLYEIVVPLTGLQRKSVIITISLVERNVNTAVFQETSLDPSSQGCSTCMGSFLLHLRDIVQVAAPGPSRPDSPRGIQSCPLWVDKASTRGIPFQ